MNKILCRAAASLVVLIASALISVQAHAQQALELNIASQPLSDALRELGTVSNTNIIFEPAMVSGIVAPALQGNITPKEALTRLLAGTRWSFKFVDENTVSLIPEDLKVAVAPASSHASPGSQPRSPTAEVGGTQDGRLRLAQSSSSSDPSPSQGEGAPKGADEEKKESSISEIVVTAQKREERLQNVPIAIKVLGGERLDSSTYDGVREALNTVPGVSIVTNANSSAQVSVRGVSAIGARNTGTGTAAYYIDSMPVGLVKSAIVPDMSAYDLERVEVLLGPQGTLYGASALNGVIRVLTKDADLNRFELKVRALTSSTEEGDINYRGDMAVNVPIVQGKAAARLVLGRESLSGWIDKPIRADANDLQTTSARLKFNAKLNESLSVGLSTWRSRADTGSHSVGGADNFSPIVIDEPSEDDFDMYGLKIVYEGSRFAITSNTGHLDAHVQNVTDFSPYAIPVVAATQIDSRVFNQELTVNSIGNNPWRWSIGGMYRDAKDVVHQWFPPSAAFVTDWDDTSKSFAVFGELTRVFLDGKVEMTGGVRYFEDDVTFLNRLNALAFDNTFDALTPRAVLKWLPTKDLTFYASFAEGYRSGVNQGTPAAAVFPPAKPDSLKNYELGAKGNVLDGKVGFEAALYYIEWKDAQAQRTITAVFGTQTITSGAMINADSASGPGIDASVTFRPIKGWTLSASANRNDLELDKDVRSGATLIASAGDRLQRSPKLTWTAATDYLFAVGNSGLEGRFTASVTHVAGHKGGLESVVLSDDIAIGRASFSLRSPRSWTATLFADNINNEHGITAALSSPALPTPPFYNGRPRPRTIGLQLEYKY